MKRKCKGHISPPEGGQNTVMYFQVQADFYERQLTGITLKMRF